MGGARYVRHVCTGLRPPAERERGACVVRGSRLHRRRGIQWIQRGRRPRPAPRRLAMCGLVGAAGTSGADEAKARAALSRLALRGPDDRGVWSEAGAMLAHCRLSILDLSNAGHQPMASADGRYVLIYNGEIYNFREVRALLPGPWRSDSDSEVILAAYARWGNEFLQRLRGMFALGIWDRQEKKLLLARDRLGVKPLYYAQRDGVVLFASRPQALFSYDPQLSTAIDVAGLSVYLEAGYFPAPF